MRIILYLTRNKILLIVIIFIFTFSCKEKIPTGYSVTKYDKEGNIVEISKKIKDTVILDSTFILSYKKRFDSNGQLKTEGQYVGKKKIGKQNYYEEGYLKYIKNYIIFNEEDISFLYAIDFFDDTIKNNKYKSYLNGKISFTENGEISLKNSSFIDLKFKEKKIKLGDSMLVNIKSYNSESKIVAMDLYLFNPENHEYMIIIHENSNNFDLKLKTTYRGEYVLNGYAVINVLKKENLYDSIYKCNVYKINKKYSVY